MKSKPKETTQPKTPEQIMEKLQADLKYWTRQLRMEDLDIELDWIEDSEHEECGVQYGLTREIRGAHLFQVYVVHPTRRTEEDAKWFSYDNEVILVHELLHVKNFNWEYNSALCPYLLNPEKKENEILSELYEESLDVFAEALVRARRGITR